MSQTNDNCSKKCGYTSTSCCGYVVGVPGPTGATGPTCRLYKSSK